MRLHDAKQHADPADRTIEVTMGDIPPVMVDPKQVSAALAEVIEQRDRGDRSSDRAC